MNASKAITSDQNRPFNFGLVSKHSFSVQSSSQNTPVGTTPKSIKPIAGEALKLQVDLTPNRPINPKEKKFIFLANSQQCSPQDESRRFAGSTPTSISTKVRTLSALNKSIEMASRRLNPLLLYDSTSGDESETRKESKWTDKNMESKFKPKQTSMVSSGFKRAHIEKHGAILSTTSYLGSAQLPHKLPGMNKASMFGLREKAVENLLPFFNHSDSTKDNYH